MTNSGEMTVGEAGRKGGKATAKKYGRKFFSKIGRKGGKKRKASSKRKKKT